MAETVKLYRLPNEGVIAGVCAGLSEYTNIDVTLLRVLFVVFAILSSGFGILVYFLLAIFTPVRGKSSAKGSSVEDNIQQVAADVAESTRSGNVRNYVGFGLILLGAYLLLQQLTPQWVRIDWDYLWPLLLIALGLIVLAQFKPTPKQK